MDRSGETSSLGTKGSMGVDRLFESLLLRCSCAACSLLDAGAGFCVCGSAAELAASWATAVALYSNIERPPQATHCRNFMLSPCRTFLINWLIGIAGNSEPHVRALTIAVVSEG